MISELQLEKERLDEAILALERLVAGKNRRRGRPSRWLASELERQVHTLDQTGAPAVSDA
ncbi:MAG TPA: hypothetical protein VK604_07400 [Bryobacteraceae bacterium]|nr:hypothetical protein [Bryobacteraceae bacterium]